MRFKLLLIAVFFLFMQNSFSQSRIENIIIVTTDGLRWEEVFGGMDSAIANNSRFHHGDSSDIFSHYWAPTEIERRKKLMPFFWSEIEKNGQLYGNRTHDNKVDNANPY